VPIDLFFSCGFKTYQTGFNNLLLKRVAGRKGYKLNNLNMVGFEKKKK